MGGRGRDLTVLSFKIIDKTPDTSRESRAGKEKEKQKELHCSETGHTVLVLGWDRPKEKEGE